MGVPLTKKHRGIMRLTFLSADRPLVKSYTLKDGKLTKESYPRVWEFTSHEEQAANLSELHAHLVQHARLGHCLLKGAVNRPLLVESRAGSTDPNAETPFAIFDLDRSGQYRSVEDFLLSVGVVNTSYIVQYSASYGVEPEKGLTAHVILLLDKPMPPAALKQWLIHLNLSTPNLVQSIELTKTNNALSWPLDVSTCQNDKLIYIAPPQLGEGVTCSFTGERIQLVQKEHACLATSALAIPAAEANRIRADQVLDELRARKGLPKRKWNIRTDKSGLDFLAKPDSATLTGIKSERGFTYFNLNGGDSWGYFHSADNPSVIRNFKGEPNYLTAELLPEYWAQLQAQQARNHAKQRAAMERPVSGRSATLAFRDFKSAVYYNGDFCAETGVLSLARAASELQLQHYLAERGLPKLDYIPVWNLVYDPASRTRVDAESKTINRFAPSRFMDRPRAAGHRSNAYADGDLQRLCPRIHRLLTSAVGRSPAVKGRFLNWFNCIYQHRMRTMMAWVLQGIEGTGKGLLLNKVLLPLLGAENVAIKRMQELEDQFNGYAESALLIAIDEAQISESRQSKMIMANLKNMITEPQISVRKMHTAAYTVPNYGNYLFLSNMADPVVISATDRRFSVGEYCLEKFDPEEGFVEGIETELEAFADFLLAHEADLTLARTVFESDERAFIQATSTNSVDSTAQAILAGNLEFFWDNLPSGEAGLLGPETQALHDSYVRLIHQALRTEDGVQRLTRDELRVLFAYNVGEVPRTPAKFTSMLRHHRLSLAPIRVQGRLVRGMAIEWKAEAGWKRERLEELNQKMPALKAVA